MFPAIVHPQIGIDSCLHWIAGTNHTLYRAQGKAFLWGRLLKNELFSFTSGHYF
jgi:hypothetical protein